MKTTAQLLAQQSRMSRLQAANVRSFVKAAHPATGGDPLLAHNWGNQAAQRLIDADRLRNHSLHLVFKRHFSQAFRTEYPDHSINQVR